jgi:creatinine amidohydrolase
MKLFANPSFPRRRESTGAKLVWIPAFAGMTNFVAGKFSMNYLFKTCIIFFGFIYLPLSAFAQKSVYLEELTTAEVSAMVKNSHSVVIIPVGGTEQNGPHMAIGKHNARVKLLAGRIAAQLVAGNVHTIVAPVLSYTPEGSINPPSEHMKWAGTVSISEEAFKSTLLSAAKSFKQHGFTDIVLIGDHGGYQSALAAVEATFNKDKSSARVHYIADYYRATSSAPSSYMAALRDKGLTDNEIGTHAGSADTSLQMAVDPSMVKPEKFAEAAKTGRAGGTLGDPRAATAALGQIGLDATVKMSVLAIQKAMLK